MKLVVVGIDGGSWEMADALIAKGLLPNIKRIKEQGCWADMQACLPPVTSPNWRCYSTGKNPGKLGIFYWENIDWENRRVYFPSERENESKSIWDYLSDAGFKVGVIGVPVTYPPPKVNGFFVSGPPDALNKGFCYPQELGTVLHTKFNFYIGDRESFLLNKEKACIEAVSKTYSTAEIGLYLLETEKPDFMQVTFFNVNELQHYTWNSQYTEQAWSIIDEFIGRVLERDYNLIVMSDHGSNKIEKVFNINCWLEQGGYLKLTSDAKNQLRKLGITKERLSIFNPVIRMLPKSLLEGLRRTIPSESGNPHVVSDKAKMIDWEGSVAIASDQGPIYTKPGWTRSPEAIKEELERNFPQIVKRVYWREEIYSGKYLPEAPSLIIDQQPNVHISGGLGLKDVLAKTSTRWIADNKRIGMFACMGGPEIPSLLEMQGEIKVEMHEDRMSILDLAPIMLNLFGLSVPEDMDNGF